METIRKIGILMIAIAVIVAAFGVWLKVYNDKIAQMQINETGTCYLSDGTCLHATSDFIFYVAIGIVIVLAGIGLYLLFHKKDAGKVVIRKSNKNSTRKSQSNNIFDTKTLNSESKKIFDIIVQSDGAILQGELVNKSGMDKVKVSRILDKLEMRGLIERRRHGMSNLVVLKKK